ncbi:MAG: hypothetical protein ABIO65_04085 [Nitrospiria bacterium]
MHTWISNRSGALFGIGLGCWIFLAGAGEGPGPGNPDAVRRHAEAMVKAGGEMVKQSAEGQLAGVIEQAHHLIANGKAAIDAVPFPGNQHARDTAEHVSEAMSQAESAITHAEQGHQDVVKTHAGKAMAQARRALSHARAL